MSRITYRDEYGDVRPEFGYTLADAVEKLTHYEDLEEQLENLYGGKMPLDEVVENLNRIVQGGEERLDYARILTNAEAEKWDRWLDLEEQDRLIELPCKVGDTVYVVDTDYTDMYDLSSQYYFVIECKFELYMITGLGIWVFLTKEEAEEKLKRLQENEQAL